MRRRILLAVGACAVLCCVFALGRASAPAPSVIVDEQAKETVTAAAISMSSATETAATSAIAETDRAEAKVVYRDRWYRVDGSIEREREVEASQLAERRTEQTAGHVHREEQASKVETVEVLREVERRVEVQAEPPRLLLGAVGGLGLDGSTVYGPQAHYRVAGPLHVSGAVLFGGEAPTVLVGLAVPLL